MVASRLQLRAILFLAYASAISEAFIAFLPKTITITTRTFQINANKEDSSQDIISDFCKGTNEFWKTRVIEPVRNYVEVQPAESVVTSTSDAFTKLTAPPERPGIPRPVWLTILGSVPTGLLWYGYYKFSVEEELYQYEMEETGKVSGGKYDNTFPL